MYYFTKRPKAIPIPDQEASTVSDELVRTWIWHYGVPMILYSDQGTNYNFVLLIELSKLLRFLKTRTTALHPETDGMVKRSAGHDMTGSTPPEMLFVELCDCPFLSGRQSDTSS
ncbi:hypothetical protein AVEN_57437-1 [Araneus ventricosus]|uniref:Integrase catalytic domain-containing protein n=1 Tax=Araneus ventricosus TaxID=182803 RepID=A0A4Y2CXR4_ARAVE|nr:hypothetical protein AVEN_57437-1 [Araneus ventricosus]